MTEPIAINNGSISVPAMHDANFFGVLSEDRKLTLCIKNTQGQRFDLVIPDIVNLYIDGFQEGNIILDVMFFNGVSCPIDYIKMACGGCELSTDYLNKIAEEIAAGMISLIYMMSSYGAEFLLSPKPLLLKFYGRVFGQHEL